MILYIGMEGVTIRLRSKLPNHGARTGVGAWIVKMGMIEHEHEHV